VQNWLRKVAFNLWYFKKPTWDTGISPPELMEFIATHRQGRALDLGCGTGTNVITLAQHGWQTSGVDFASKAIAMAKRKARQTGVNADFRVGDVTKPDGIVPPFDLVLDIGCFQSLSSTSKQDYVRNLIHFLAPDGTFLLYGFFKTAESDEFGLTPSDLELLGSNLALVQRRDGTERGLRPSAWFIYLPKSITVKGAPRVTR
jgi:2-polyprenyl-3-methyl-5-hydroxy-6-metoxy-1,4-benzoquinol methylase